MAQLTGLFQRGSAYYIKIVLPKDHPLKPNYRNGRFVQTLGVCSHREAVRRGTLKRAEVLWGVSGTLLGPALSPASSLQVALDPPSSTLKRPALTLRGVYDRWKLAKCRSQDAEAACLRAVMLFEECLGKELDLMHLTRAQGDQFRAWLLTKVVASKTSRDRFTWIKSLLKYAVRDLEALPKSAWEGLDITHKTTARRRPWRTEELQRLFGQALFTRYALPNSPKAGRDAAYWVPLIGLFMGARISEVAQLQVEDIHRSGHVPMLSITDQGERRQVKTAAGIRTLPIHPELIRLGFLEYVQAAEEAGAVSLWPALKLREGRPGGYLSAWFGEFRNAAGLTEKYPDFHCFRHTARTLMARAGVRVEVQDTITGHEVQGSTGSRVYRHVHEDELVRAVASINYPGLALPKVYAPNKG